MSEKDKRRSASVTCSDPRISNSFTFYLNGDVTERTRKRIESHLMHCSDCMKMIGLLKLVKHLRKSKKRNTFRPSLS
jgi:predicted anti-sigma-YlaC factor YlaD